MDTFSDLPGTSLSLLSSEYHEPTSTLQYVNAQLVSHGFARSPGLSLDGLANDDSERLIKCLLGMLSQRIEDLGRTEELSSKLRTLSYEYERLQSMHRTAVDASANAEREMHLFKSKLAASQKLLATETTAHKQTLAELQRTRTSLQYLRSTTQNELKRKDKDIERVMERWNKVSDAQAKLLIIPSGLRCANLAVGTAEPVRGTGLMEQALGQAEEARCELVKENDAFRTVILGAANALQGNIYTVRGRAAEEHIEEPVPLSHPALFAPPTSLLSQPDNAHAKLRELFTAFRDAIDNIPAPTPAGTCLPGAEDEIKQLNELIMSLRAELQQSRLSSTTLAAQSQELLDRFTTHASERLISGRDPTPEEAAEMSLELIGVPEQDEIREKLEARAAELKAERERFTEAAIKLGKEKAALELERTRMLEEKRRWAVEQMLAELPSTPGPDPDLVSPPRPTKSRLKPGSPSPPRIRPRKVSGSRGSLGSPSKKAAAVMRAPGGLATEKFESRGGDKKLKQKRKSSAFGTLEVLYQPERDADGQAPDADAGLQRSTTPEDSPPITTSVPVAAEMRTSIPFVLPTSSTFPPPSSTSSLTTMDFLPSQSSDQRQQPPTAIPSFDAIPLSPAPLVTAPPARSRLFASPRTPRPLGLNPSLKHAYSPVRPSPLSRILMLADSPPSPPPVPPIQEEPEESDENDSPPPRANIVAKRLLAREFAPLDEPSPLRERTDFNGNAGGDAKPHGKSEEKRFTAKEKGKGRATSAMQGPTASEKENVVAMGGNKPKASMLSSTSASNVKTKASKASAPAPEMKKLTGARLTLKPPAVKSGGILKLAGGSGPGSFAATAHTGVGNAGGSAVRPGGARRIPIGNANAGKLGLKKV